MAIDKMEIDTPQILTASEQQQVAEKVTQNLVHHLYKSTVSGVITGFLTNVSTMCYLYFIESPDNFRLISWFVGFNLILLILLIINILYQKNYRTLLNFNYWKWAFFVCIFCCAIFWGSLITFMTDSIITQLLIITMLIMLSSAYSMGTVGSFELCLVTLLCMLLPLTVWAISQGRIYYITGAAFLVIYCLYLLGMNYRSTSWLIGSLRLEIENSFFTYQANHDPITNLPNYRPLLFHVENCIKHAKANNSCFMIIYFSINNLDMFSSGLGYQAVDDMMILLTKRLSLLLNNLTDKDKYFAAVPRSDTITIVINPIEVGDEAAHINNISQVLNKPFYLNNKENRLTASLGVSFFPKDGLDAITLQRNAQAALFKAKQTGGDHTEFYAADINLHIPRRLELSNDLHRAIEENAFLIYYQPIISIATGKIYSAEALLRWEHAKYGMISPEEFIKLAEDLGVINKLGEYVFATVCQQQKEWQEKYGLEAKIAINISVKQLHSVDFTDLITVCTEKGLLDPNFIELEITESEALDDQAVPYIQRLVDMGFAISIDDFGTGYAGMKFLQKFKISKIKIDQSFIKALPENIEDRKLVLSVLAMAKELNIKTLAEGVETAAQRDFLIENNCDYLQGYFYSKALPSTEFRKLFLENK